MKKKHLYAFAKVKISGFPSPVFISTTVSSGEHTHTPHTPRVTKTRQASNTNMSTASNQPIHTHKQKHIHTLGQVLAHTILNGHMSEKCVMDLSDL